jgi:hypothetical protein
MMIDTKQKGATAETKARDELRKLTGLKWERVPGSGALDPKHLLKGDLYVPGEGNLYSVEVKHYGTCQIDHSLISSINPQILVWWEQALRQGNQVNKLPLLIFKHDRSKFYVGFMEEPKNLDAYNWVFISNIKGCLYLAELKDWILNEQPRFING